MTITVLTPTYNRRGLLQRLYDSLCLQTDMDFEWLIVDDGSTDGTDAMVDDLKKDARFSIRYEWKENGGKHTALNYAYRSIFTPLTFIVDSDDRLTPDAIATVKAEYNKYKEEKDLCGYSFLRGRSGGGYLSDHGIPEDGMKESYLKCRIDRGIGGDMAEVWYTDRLKEFPFPVFQGEKFLGEDIVWIQMAKKYKMRFFDRVIYISDYLSDGLTNKRRIHNIASPNGCVARAETFLDADVKLTVKIKAMLQYHVYGRFAGFSSWELLMRSSKKMLYITLFIPAHLIYKKWRMEHGYIDDQ